LPAEEHARLADYVQRVAEGNPFFAGEALRALEEVGFLSRDGEAWRVGNLDTVQVPALVRQVIETRLARLGEAAQELLQAAAVIGHEVPVELWMEVSGADEMRLAETLERAVEARLVEELRGGERFRFTHALIRETLYEGLVSIRRRSWHRRIAEALEHDPRPDPDLVAHHYVQLNDPRAVAWLVRAADRAEMSYARIIAVERLEIAGHLLEEDESRTAERGWLVLRVAMLARTFDPRRGVSYTVDVERIGEQIGDQLLRAMAICYRAVALSFLAEFERSLATMRDVGPIMERLTPADLERLFRLTRTMTFNESATVRGDEIERIVTEVDVKRWINAVVLTMFLSRSGRLNEALSIGERQVAAYERIAPGLSSDSWYHSMAAEPRGGMGYAYAALGQPDDARRVLAESQRALQLWDERYVLYQRFGLALLHVVMPYMADDLAERERLVEVLQDAHASAAGSMHGAGIPLLGQHYILGGAWDKAWVDAETALASTSHGWDLMIARLTLGQIALLRGLQSTPDWLAPLLPNGPTTDPSQSLLLEGLHAQRLLAKEALGRSDVTAARGWLEAHDRWLDQTGAVLGRADGLIVWSRYHQQLGDVKQAESCVREAIEQASTPRQPLALLAAQRQLGAVLTVTGDHEAAHLHLRGALALAEACAGPFERALTLIALAELWLANGDHEAVCTLLAESNAICEPLQARPTLEHIITLFDAASQTS
jgi:tetratricopeptide (TPR) repeat protein